MRPLVKICGLMRPEDARLAAALGATHIGAVRSPDSPRSVDSETAKRVFEAGGEGVAKVFVFRGVAIDDVVTQARSAGADIVQIYDASDDDIDRLEGEGFRVFRVCRVREDAPELPVVEPAPTEARPALLDVGGGGTGRRFDWSLLTEHAPAYTFIAGGIGPDNVRELLAKKPYGIDLASGVESEPGVKDAKKLEALFEEITR